MLHYTDLAESKGIVLMVGEFDNKVLVSEHHFDPTDDTTTAPGSQGCEVPCGHAGDILQVLQALPPSSVPSRPSGRKLELLQKFTNSPALFRHMDLIEELNLIQLEPEVSANGQA
jgi:hypothetical protein